MATFVLIRQKAEMSNLQPNLGEARHQQLRGSPFAPTLLFHSQGGRGVSYQKGTPKITISPFFGPHNKNRGSYRKCPYGRQSTPSSNQSFPSGRGNSNRGNKDIFVLIAGAEAMENLLSNNCLASISPPVGGCLCLQRLAKRKVPKICVKHYYKWLRSYNLS